jgi:uncharacterized protein (TIGR03437 family)
VFALDAKTGKVLWTYDPKVSRERAYFATQRVIPYATSNLNLFANLTSNQVNCPRANLIASGVQPLAANADGSSNSCDNPAQYGSTVSLFVHGVGTFSYGHPPPPQLEALQALADQCSTAIEDATLVNGFVYKVDIQLPASLHACAASFSNAPEQGLYLTLSYRGSPVGPLNLFGAPMGMVVWVSQ